MCSSVLGPAMPPPLVTCPTKRTPGPASFATRMSRAAHSGPGPRSPGAPSSSPVYVVWIESTNTTRAPMAWACGMMSSSRVSPSTWTRPASTASRSARSRIWSGDSSPDTYNVGTPACSRRAAHWSKRVDFPIPGSPPTSVTEPGTMPPPSTKSNSASPVRQRSAPPALTSARRTGGGPAGRPARERRCARPGAWRPSGSSARVFHAPHASQRPAHFGCSAPQSVQRNTEWALATSRLGRRLARREVVEPRVFLLEEQLHRPGRAVALLADAQLGEPFDVFVGLRVDGAIVELLPVDEAHDVGVLFDRTRFPQVRELGPAVFAAALLWGPGQLRQRDHGDVDLLGQRPDPAVG